MNTYYITHWILNIDLLHLYHHDTFTPFPREILTPPSPKVQTVEESQGHMQSVIGPGHAQDFRVHLPTGQKKQEDHPRYGMKSCPPGNDAIFHRKGKVLSSSNRPWVGIVSSKEL